MVTFIGGHEANQVTKGVVHDDVQRAEFLTNLADHTADLIGLDTLRLVCFYAANSSSPRPDDADWPRVMGVGFELPGRASGFSLLQPLDDEWELVEGRPVPIAGRGTVALDFAIVARVNPKGFRKGPHDPGGIPPGQPATRGSGTRFCVSGPFPDTLPDPSDPSKTVATTIEGIINGVVVTFHGVEPRGRSTGFGLWENPLRSVPLYQE